MDFLPKEIEQYCTLHSDAEDELLKKIARETQTQVMMPRMLSGHLQGRVLSMISKMIRPEGILEIGTYTGYSALCLAEGLTPSGRLYTIDINEELEDRVRAYFGESRYNDQIEYVIGDAREEITKIDRQVDLVFIDADKENYLQYLHLVWPKLRKGGYIIADNVLWSGKVLAEGKKDKDTEAIIAFNTTIAKDGRLEKVMLPVRDGLYIMRKKAD